MANETTDAISKELARYDSSRYHMLLPKSVATQACTWIAPRLSIVEINPNKDAGDVYPVGRGGEDDDDDSQKNANAKFGLAKPAIMRLANAAGIDFNPDKSRALSASADYVLYQAVGDMRGPDGTRITGTSTKEIDLRVKEAEIREQKQRTANKWKWTTTRTEQAVQSELLQWRKNKFMRAETGAQERVVKALLAMRPAYTLAELQLPFVVVRFDINFDHPDIKKMFAAQGAFAAQALYGGSKSKFFVGAASTVIDADVVIKDDDEDDAPAPFAAAQPDPAPGQTAPVSAPRFDPVAAAQEILGQAESAATSMQEALTKSPAPQEPLGQPVPVAKPTTNQAGGDVCEGSGCTAKVTAGVAAFSKNKFEGKVYCMNCQKKVGAPA